ncbi:TrkH family potassium uptake protein [Salarchaeum sp. JOR-1]|uniref:TrkH family potassium uptake protein n=1 Tax=Salarchaeum sp. JOR-1 TaxID=2599399 RepID=UPI00119839A9|nr:TrkH family potassium uptake protein [Salarchaeum sp. JOR-1]QDX41004.1 TrkH family potassium uptake protein [Salarchaeum sp. JOR-1]
MSLRVRWRASLKLIGVVLKWLWVPLTAPLLLALYDGTQVVPFLAPMVVTVTVGLALERISSNADVHVREAFLMVALTWLSVALVGSIPFALAQNGVLAHPVNALFESMSGVTTTGATVIVDFDAHSRAIFLWRSLLQWLGGLGVLVLATAVLSRVSVGGAQLMETETQTKDVKLTPQISDTARLLWSIYITLTALAVVVLYSLNVAGVAPEMTLFDAVAHALTSVSTSGFSPRANSIAAFSPAVQWALVVFMVAGATSFVLIYHAATGDTKRARNSSEFRFYIGALAAFSLTAIVLLSLDAGLELSGMATIRHAVFQVVSIVTTTGYASTDFNVWSSSAKALLFAGMFVGGMAGSTTCSIKAVRWLVVLKSLRRNLYTSALPDAVRPVRLGESVVAEDTIRDIYAYVLLTLVIFAAAAAFVAVDAARVALPVSEFEAMGAAASTFLNIGPAFGLAGPLANYESFPASTKLVMTALMWIGRIEIMPVLVLLTPTFWRS